MLLRVFLEFGVLWLYNLFTMKNQDCEFKYSKNLLYYCEGHLIMPKNKKNTLLMLLIRGTDLQYNRKRNIYIKISDIGRQITVF